MTPATVPPPLPLPPSMGPSPTLLSRKEVDALYQVFQCVLQAFQELQIEYIITGGSLLGAVRQHSILFCDDDIDVAVLEHHLPTVRAHLQEQLWQQQQQQHSDRHDSNDTHNKGNPQKQAPLYQIEPWEAGDRVRHAIYHNAFVDIFAIRKYHNQQELTDVIGTKANGTPQSHEYIQSILNTIYQALDRPEIDGTDMDNSPTNRKDNDHRFPNGKTGGLWHFTTRKAIELWPKEVYRHEELFPIRNDYRMGPLVGIAGPQMPVTLLKRAFGHDCFQCYYQSNSHQQQSSISSIPVSSVSISHQNPPTNETGAWLAPRVRGGGVWEHGPRRPLRQDMYIPMQPTLKKHRRPTSHTYSKLMQYLAQQSFEERPDRTVYMDGVFDMFHIGHVEAIQQCIQLGNRVIIGVTGDEDAVGYKRRPFMNQTERVAMIEALQGVDYVVCPCPLVVTEEFLEEYGIDLVVHGFANDDDAKRQEEFFAIPMHLGKFQRIRYSNKQSTTNLIQSIMDVESSNEPTWTSRSQWFGRDVVTWSDGAPSIDYDPVPLALRQVMEPHIEKARIKRKKSLQGYDPVLLLHFEERFGKIGQIELEEEVVSEMRRCLLKCINLPLNFDLRRLHQHPDAKNTLMRHLLENYAAFQVDYHRLVRDVCLPHLVTLDSETDIVYYQAFPCLRVVQPEEFSIGPHADCSYGHHPCTINMYLSMTPIASGNTGSLFIESRRGAEDWHPLLIDNCQGVIQHFPGATLLHWTTENKTKDTRVTLDFRIIPGKYYDAFQADDVYRSNPGYYCRAQRAPWGGWQRDESEPMPIPDSRFGYPWTRMKELL